MPDKKLTRIDLFLVPAIQEDLTKMQTKLNMWNTTNMLVKYKSSVVGNCILFEVIRLKPEE